MKSIEELIDEAQKADLKVYLDKNVSLDELTGIVFYYAVWGGGTRNLKFLLEYIPSGSKIEVYIFDLDKSYYEQYLRDKIGTAGGWGDIFWLKHGKVLAEIHELLREDNAASKLMHYTNELQVNYPH